MANEVNLIFATFCATLICQCESERLRRPFIHTDEGFIVQFALLWHWHHKFIFSSFAVTKIIGCSWIQQSASMSHTHIRIQVV